uniref:Uncharacterized protein n=1 Tax=Anguilla anguilla TaxID=7936 RepID=A0A0E9Q4P0_ANGAN
MLKKMIVLYKYTSLFRLLLFLRSMLKPCLVKCGRVSMAVYHLP